MEQVLSAFGIDWRLLIFNSINFGLMLLALTYFLYKPLMRILDERRGKVAQGVLDAQAAEEKLVEVEHSRQEVLAQAGFEADELLAHTRRAAAEAEREARERGEEMLPSRLDTGEVEHETVMLIAGERLVGRVPVAEVRLGPTRAGAAGIDLGEGSRDPVADACGQGTRGHSVSSCHGSRRRPGAVPRAFREGFSRMIKYVSKLEAAM